MTDWLLLPPWGITITAAISLFLLLLIVGRSLSEKNKTATRRQWKFLLFRTAAISLLILIALNPTLMLPRQFTDKPTLTCLVDTSGSMATNDTPEQSRLATALKVLHDQETITRLQSSLNLDTYGFDADLKPLTPTALSPELAKGLKSEIGAALAETVDSLKDKEQAGVLLISDGRATDTSALDAARLALAHSIPVWTWCVGGMVEQKDLRLEIKSHELLAFGGDRVELTGVLHQKGFDHQSFKVELLTDDTLIESKEVVPDSSGSASFAINIKAPKQGEHRYVFRVKPRKQEVDVLNNEAAVYLRVVGEKVRVLLAEGEPNWDSKFLVQTLKRNPRVDMTAVYRLGPDRWVAVVSNRDGSQRTKQDLFPRTAEQFDNYDVIVMGKSCQGFFDENTSALLSDFVANGGSLIFSRGKPYGGRFAPLAKLEPIIWGSNTNPSVRLTPEAILSGPLSDLFDSTTSTLSPDQLPALNNVKQVSGLKPLAEVLVKGAQSDTQQEYPMMITQLYGRGRVVTINSAGLWRWAFHGMEEKKAKALYDHFWINCLRWLLAGGDFLAGHNVALRSDLRLYTDEMEPRFLVRTRGIEQQSYQPQLSISNETTNISVTPHRLTDAIYSAESSPLTPGVYKVNLKNNIGYPPELSMTIEVVSSSIENRELSADPDLMAQIAELTSGKALNAEEVAQLDQIYRQWQNASMLADRQEPLWHHWLLLSLIIGFLTTEWLLRRKEGLV